MKLTLLLTICLFTSALYAQHQLKGTIVNQENIPVDFAQLYLYDLKGELIQQSNTNEQGIFVLDNIAQNHYKLQVFNLNTMQYDQPIAITQNQDIGTITINSSSNLDEIVVKTNAKLYERKIDRTVFNIENSIHATNNDVTDLLKLTPGLKLDTESITLIGKGSVRVMIDERMIQLSGEALLNYLKTIPSENIAKIEVITSPPAKYDAEGNSGLINIVLKEAKQNAWNNQISTGFRAADKASWKIGNIFNYNKNKVSINAGVSATTGYSQVFERSTLYYVDQTWQELNRRTRNKDDFSGNFQIDYKATDKTSFGVQYRGGKYQPGEKDNNNTHVNNFVDNTYKTIRTKGKNEDDVNNHSLNAHITQKFDTLGTKLSVDVDYFIYTSDRTRVFNTYQHDVDNIVNNRFTAKSGGNQNIENYSAKVDMEQPLKWFKFSYGAKASFITTTNKTNFFNLTSGTPIEDPNQKDNFKYNENTQAIYVNGSKSFANKWEAQLGLRFETTQTTGSSATYNTKDSKKYNKLFPTVYLSYAMNDNNNFTLSYNKRISRPSFWELNPFRWYINEYSYVEGNPKIQPAFIDNIELTHTFKNKLTTTIGYSKTKNDFNQYSLVNPKTNVQTHLRDNIFDTYSVNGSISYTNNTFAWLQSQNTLNVFYSDTKLIKDLDLQTTKGWGTYFSTNNTINFNADKTLQAQVDFWIQPKLNANMYEIQTAYGLDIGGKYAMLDKKLNLSVYINDIFRTGNPDMTTSSNGVKQTFNVYYDQRYINIGLSYAFGNTKIKVKEHQGGNKDELNRN